MLDFERLQYLSGILRLSLRFTKEPSCDYVLRLRPCVCVRGHLRQNSTTNWSTEVVANITWYVCEVCVHPRLHEFHTVRSSCALKVFVTR